MKEHDMTAKELHNAFVEKHDKTPDEWIKSLNEKCWDGYKQLGMKKKGKKMVPNCVKDDSINENKSGDESLRDWFTKSRASDGTPGWVQLGGKYAGKPCAKQPGQTTKPKCGSSKMKAELSDKEEERAFRRKNRKDPNPDRKGKAKMVATEGYMDIKVGNQRITKSGGNVIRDTTKGIDNTNKPTPKPKPTTPTYSRPSTPTRTSRPTPPVRSSTTSRPTTSTGSKPKQNYGQIGNPANFGGNLRFVKDRAAERNRILNQLKQGYEPTGDQINEKKDACYKKVKSRYKVWPSAYASGALVKCRKVGAKNWGTKSEETNIDEKVDVTKQSSKRKSLGRGSSIRHGAKKTGYESPAEFRDTQKKLAPYQKEGYEFSNWRDDFKAIEYQFTDLIKPDQLKESADVRYCPKCKKKETAKECKYGESYWKLFSIPASLDPNPYDPNEIHPANENVSFEIGSGHKKAQKMSKIRNLQKKSTGGEKTAASSALKRMGGGISLPLVDSVIQPGQLTTEDYQRLQSTGNVYFIMLMWRGKTYSLQLFFSGPKRPSREQVKDEIQKFYPGSVLTHFYPSQSDPTKPIVVIQR